MELRKKNLHIIRDEKFFDSAFRIFEEVEPGLNEFVIFGKKHKLFHIKLAKVRFLKSTYLYYFWFFLKFRYKSIVIHGLYSEFLKYFIIKNKKSIPVVWIGWGFDYGAYYRVNLFKEKTNKLVLEYNLGREVQISNRFMSFLKVKADEKKVLSNINYCAPVLENEFEIVNGFYPDSGMAFIDWNYLTIEDDIIKGFEDARIEGNNLMFGNSSNPLNNHLDGFEEIDRFKFSFDRIICPLSYGDKTNKKHVLKLGSELYGARFIPIIDFLEYREYVNCLISCKYLFVNSIRQIALGNIVLMLYLGAYVILDRRNPVYTFFRSKNIQVFCIEEATPGELPAIDLETTRKGLVEIWGKEVILEKTRHLLSALNN